MKKESKRIQKLKSLITKNSYFLDEAISLLKNLNSVKFEFHIKKV